MFVFVYCVLVCVICDVWWLFVCVFVIGEKFVIVLVINEIMSLCEFDEIVFVFYIIVIVFDFYVDWCGFCK